MEQMSVESNVANRIGLLREGVVFDHLAFVGETIQNSQRAGAKRVWVTIKETGCDTVTVIVQDDGKGAKNPKKVFSLDESDWAGVFFRPFGVGFSSWYICDRLEAQSRNWSAKMDIKAAVARSSFDDAIHVTWGDTTYQGFCVRGEFPLSSALNEYTIKEEFKKIGAMIRPALYINSVEVTKKAIDLGSYMYTKKMRGIGEIACAPVTDSEPDILEVICEGRPVGNIEGKGLKGILSLNPDAVNLKAPDRKEIINDEKRNTLMERIRTAGAEAYKKSVPLMKEDINNYQHNIAAYLSPREYARYLDFGLGGLVPVKKSCPQEIKIAGMDSAVFTATESCGVVSTANFVSYSGATVPEENDSIEILKKLKQKFKVFYVQNYMETMHKTLINNLEYWGIKVIRTTGVLQQEVMRYLNIPHVQNADHSVERQYKFQNEGIASSKERVLLSMLETISRELYKLDSSPFVFAEIKTKLITKILDKVVRKEKTSTLGCLSRKRDENGEKINKIYLNRKLLGVRQLPASTGDNPFASAKNCKALMVLLPTVAHELSHLLYESEDGTLEHHEYISHISREIANFVAQK